MKFIFDPDKSAGNEKKHGIGFDEARRLWLDERLLRFRARDGEGDEERFLFIGKIRNRHWAAIATYRDNTIRLISVRRAREKEIEAYENEKF